MYGIKINLKDVKRTRKVPVKTLKTVSSTAGGWSIGAAGGASGAWIGTKTGTMIGTICGGPVGAAIIIEEKKKKYVKNFKRTLMESCIRHPIRANFQLQKFPQKFFFHSLFFHFIRPRCRVNYSRGFKAARQIINYSRAHRTYKIHMYTCKVHNI